MPLSIPPHSPPGISLILCILPPLLLFPTSAQPVPSFVCLCLRGHPRLSGCWVSALDEGAPGQAAQPVMCWPEPQCGSEGRVPFSLVLRAAELGGLYRCHGGAVRAGTRPVAAGVGGMPGAPSVTGTCPRCSAPTPMRITTGATRMWTPWLRPPSTSWRSGWRGWSCSLWSWRRVRGYARTQDPRGGVGGPEDVLGSLLRQHPSPAPVRSLHLAHQGTFATSPRLRALWGGSRAVRVSDGHSQAPSGQSGRGSPTPHTLMCHQGHLTGAD